ncbi:MAG TPA: GNAT family N-acetyltransferase [Candidatus Gemmiger avistercoris]|uniref:GNAT family N-acetyltransferase n=1 Tax=Candidatus Gemmiger avistercoris TaxID=2838606 RepID=A0A9D2FL33_9FIRM|nr:GNAT family protein [uncultured Subdoligranulum sp.]HIZ62610.1 GNAT family N-acetyltransferase [Candidatus Gemmiger avistercoris]
MEKLPCITGERVVLRPITDGDTDHIVTWRNTPSVMQNFIFRQQFTPEMHRNWLATKVATGQVVQYIIVDKAEDRPVGSVYFRDIDPVNHSAEYGIFIGEEDARGQGFGSETARLFTEFGFARLGLHRISLRLLEENLPARRSYEKAGFVQEGIFHDMVMLDGQYRDVVFMAKLAPVAQQEESL